MDFFCGGYWYNIVSIVIAIVSLVIGIKSLIYSIKGYHISKKASEEAAVAAEKSIEIQREISKFNLKKEIINEYQTDLLSALNQKEYMERAESLMRILRRIQNSGYNSSVDEAVRSMESALSSMSSDYPFDNARRQSAFSKAEGAIQAHIDKLREDISK